MAANSQRVRFEKSVLLDCLSMGNELILIDKDSMREKLVEADRIEIE
jgi:hypothetical protein